MAHPDHTSETMPHCECGYRCRGATLDAQVCDAQRHAWDVHGIEVTRAQVLASRAEASPRGGTA